MGFAEARDVGKAIQSIARRDYGRALRKCLDKSQVLQIVAEATAAVWPLLNREPVRLVSADRFMRHWSKLGVQFQVAKLGGPEGLALLGFYARKVGPAKRPLICVNTAHHPAAVGAAFSHEMGHHLTARIFESNNEYAQFLAASAYEEHLTDPAELAADCLVSIGVLPQNIARTLFGDDVETRSKQLNRGQIEKSLFATVIGYFGTRYGLDFAGLGPEPGQQYLTALIHYAKLRRALLLEYDI